MTGMTSVKEIVERFEMPFDELRRKATAAGVDLTLKDRKVGRKVAGAIVLSQLAGVNEQTVWAWGRTRVGIPRGEGGVNWDRIQRAAEVAGVTVTLEELHEAL